MAKIQEYIVTEPPTSDGLQERAIASLSASQAASRGILSLTIEALQEVPRPTTEQLIVRVKRPTYSDEGNMTSLEGRAVIPESAGVRYLAGSVIIEFADELSQPAHVSIITD